MSQTDQPQMNADSLYKEEIFTDQTVGQIRRYSPVTASGEPDDSRQALFGGSAQMMSPAGPIPLNFAIEATNLEEAVAGFSEAAKQAVEETMKELEAMRREQASSIVVPGQKSGGGIQLP